MTPGSQDVEMSEVFQNDHFRSAVGDQLHQALPNLRRRFAVIFSIEKERWKLYRSRDL